MMMPSTKEKANILLVDDQPGKLASYEVILSELDENLIKASSAKEADDPRASALQGYGHHLHLGRAAL
jgi:response regulator RpfG family c-di-GMP phosphodiesterase